MPNDDAQEKELLERYRRASNADTAAPSEAVRAAILAEGRRAADARAKELRGQPFDTSRPAANDSRWKITAFGTAGAALLAVFLFAPRLWETAPPSPPRSEATSRDAPAEKAAPQNYAAAPAAEPPAAASSSRPPAFSENASRAASARAAPSPIPSSLGADRAGRMRSESQDALQSAAASGDAAHTATLLDQGVPLDARDEHGRTALMRAVMQNKLKVVRLLLDRGADPNLPDNSGSTPLQQAKRENLGEISAMLEAAGAH
jgi:ankyrin repeat protein